MWCGEGAGPGSRAGPRGQASGLALTRNWSLSRIRDGPAPSALAGPACEGPGDQMPLPCGPSPGQAHGGTQPVSWGLRECFRSARVIQMPRAPCRAAREARGPGSALGRGSTLPPNSHGLPPAGPHGCSVHSCQDKSPLPAWASAPGDGPQGPPSQGSTGKSHPLSRSQCHFKGGPTRPPPGVLSSPHCTSHSLQEAVLREETAQGPGARGTPRTAALTPQQQLG